MQKQVITISHKRLIELVRHDNSIGHFVWNKSRPRYSQAGAVAGSLHASTGIWRTCLDGKSYQEHDLVWFYYYPEHRQERIEHINGVRSDNRIENLRPKTVVVTVDSMDLISMDLLKDRLAYDEQTGIFTWKRSAGRIKAGGRAGCAGPFGYRVIGFGKMLFREHRLAWYFFYGEVPPHDIDHINGIRDDNRIANLRIATDAENNQNKAKTKITVSSSKYIGVSKCSRSNKWVASIKVGKKSYFIGAFDSEENAYAAYLARKKEVHKFQPFVRVGANHE